MHIKRFASGLWEQWGTLMTGVASIPLTVLAFVAPTVPQKVAWGVFAFACVVLAAYRVWASEHKQVVELSAKLDRQRPRLTVGHEIRYPGSNNLPPWETLRPIYVRNDGNETAYNVAIGPITPPFGTLRFSHAENVPPGEVVRLSIFRGSESIGARLFGALISAPDGTPLDQTAIGEAFKRGETVEQRWPLHVMYRGERESYEENYALVLRLSEGYSELTVEREELTSSPQTA